MLDTAHEDSTGETFLIITTSHPSGRFQAGRVFARFETHGYSSKFKCLFGMKMATASLVLTWRVSSGRRVGSSQLITGLAIARREGPQRFFLQDWRSAVPGLPGDAAWGGTLGFRQVAIHRHRPAQRTIGHLGIRLDLVRTGSARDEIHH